MTDQRFAFVASTGRTATTFLASTLNSLPMVTAMHEGHLVGDTAVPVLPLINLQNRAAWFDPEMARRTVVDRRACADLQTAGSQAEVVVDVAFYNAPLFEALATKHRSAHFFMMFRRCESFVRSATILVGEDLQPAGWPAPNKPLTDREKFIELGRLRPKSGTAEAESWARWSGIQRNIWLWTTINTHLIWVRNRFPRTVTLLFEDLAEQPNRFWSTLLQELGLDRPEWLAQCVNCSQTPVNARGHYQVGPLNSWTKNEQAMFERLAKPLEVRIYG